MDELPPPSDKTILAFDADGREWLLRFNVPGAEGVWQALGYDERNFPCAKLATAANIVRWQAPEQAGG